MPHIIRQPESFLYAKKNKGGYLLHRPEKMIIINEKSTGFILGLSLSTDTKHTGGNENEPY